MNVDGCKPTISTTATVLMGLHLSYTEKRNEYKTVS